MDNPSQNFPTKYWHILPNGRVQCDVCPQACKLIEEQRGVCFVRMRKNNQIVLTTYGRTSGFCVDPVEKKPLYHFLPGTPILSFGTAGCNLACKFCQNCDISKIHATDILTEIAPPEAIANTAIKLNCSSVAFTYNEPIVFMEYALDTAKACHKRGIKTVAVTNGYICDAPRKEFFSYMDAANVDLKGFTDIFYRKITSSTLQPVLDTLYYLHHETKVWLEITTLLIPGENDSEEEIEAETQWIRENLGPDVPIHFTAFHPAWRMMDKPPTQIETLIRAYNVACKNGLRYVYIGNIYDTKGSTTFCHNCKKAVIIRDNYTIRSYNLNTAGKCKFCGTECQGIFAGGAGHWGAKRISMAELESNF